MFVLDLILIGIALSMDACALTIANCTTYGKSLNRKKEWSMPIAFAIFQGIMPLIGYFIGTTFSGYIQGFSGYLTAIVFFILFGKILYDLIKEKLSPKMEEINKKAETKNNFTLLILLIQALATSIDALFIGVTLSFNCALPIYIAVSIIAVVTFILVMIALLFGKYLGKALGKYAEYVGALILFVLAVKTLIEAIIG